MKKVLRITCVLIFIFGCKRNIDRSKELNNKAITIYGNNFNNDDSLKYAIKLLDSAILLRSTYINFYFNKYKLTMKIKDYRSAIECCDKIMKIDPEIYMTYIDKACALEQKGQIDSSKYYYRQAIVQLNHSNFRIKDLMFQKYQEVILYKLLNDSIKVRSKMREFRNEFEKNKDFQETYNNLENFDRKDYTKGY